jgi:hypothetical protein
MYIGAFGLSVVKFRCFPAAYFGQIGVCARSDLEFDMRTHIYSPGFAAIGFAVCTIPRLHYQTLLASTAFVGATAFMLGVDCFTTAGLKEVCPGPFWSSFLSTHG